MKSSPNKICPCLDKNHVGETMTGVRFNYESELTSVNKRIVNLCVKCPFWDEETLVGKCIFDKKEVNNDNQKEIVVGIN